MQDLRYTFRMLRKTPLFTAAVVLTVALGIGATTAIFTVVNAVMLRPLPYANPDRLVWVAERNDRLNLATFSASVLNYLSWKEQAHSFDALGAVGFASFNLTGTGEPEQLTGGTLTPSIFPLLGVSPVAGRSFLDGEDRPGAEPVAMISESLWRRRFGADPKVVGGQVTLNGTNRTVVGVVPSSVALLSPGDVWVPLPVDPARQNRLNHVILAVGRMKPNVTLEQAQSDMDAVSRAMASQYPEIKDWGIRLVTFYRLFVGTQLQTSLLVLLGGVACVLLIACANVANLLLSRAIAREREMAVRTALGASRGRLLKQLLVESLVLASIGGGLGLVAAVWAVRLINAGLPAGVLPFPTVSMDSTVVLFGLAVTLVTGLLFGLAPAWSMARTELTRSLKQADRSSAGKGRAVVRNGLAAAELALATMLLVGAGLLGRSLLALERVDIGFQPDHMLTFQLSPPVSKYPLDSKASLFYQSLLESLKTIPGVRDAAISSGVPFGQGNYTTTPFTALGSSPLPPDTPVPIDWRIVSPDFFKTMGVPVLRGRIFTDGDVPTGPSIAIVSHATAVRFFGDENPIGRVIRRVADGKELTIVGEVGDVKNFALSQETPAMYYPLASRVWPRMDVIVKTVGEPASVLASVREKVRELDRDVPVSTVRTEEEWVSGSAAQPRLNAFLLGAFAAAALLVAAIGVYGVLAYSVTQRTREIGLRMALGAQRSGVLRLVVREGMIVGLVGIALGAAGALALGRVLSNLVFGVPVRDPMTFAVVAGILTIVALAACVVPARKASRVDPLVALRTE
ncbi:MAG TPA: ABC transporter permease [Vicinamibacterales bacterium]|nr:ABC transporter permease [Vicinamibacterales bacterium]